MMHLSLLFVALINATPSSGQDAKPHSAVRMADAAGQLLASLSADQKKVCQFGFDDP